MSGSIRPSTMAPGLPNEILAEISLYVHWSTKLSMMQCSRQFYFTIQPCLYRSIAIGYSTPLGELNEIQSDEQLKALIRCLKSNPHLQKEVHYFHVDYEDDHYGLWKGVEFDNLVVASMFYSSFSETVHIPECDMILNPLRGDKHRNNALETLNLFIRCAVDQPSPFPLVVTEQGTPNALQLSNLRRLDLEGISMSENSIIGLASCINWSKLEALTLDIRDCTLRRILTPEYSRQAKSLTNLRVSFNVMDSSVLDFVSNVTSNRLQRVTLVYDRTFDLALLKSWQPKIDFYSREVGAFETTLLLNICQISPKICYRFNLDLKLAVSLLTDLHARLRETNY